ncbi:hypothetical protein IJI91_03560 [Candidatus Saccharibacteria bacterium]|nr:hypothetical protein [Candidatus Saccharibacteria bacterium]
MTFFARFKKRFYFVAAKYFRFFADRSLQRWRPRVIAITGSVGKTTMLHLVEAELGDKAHYSHDANSAFGIAFDILGLQGIRGSKLRWLYLFPAALIRSFYYTRHEKFYVVEIDGERPRETEFLASWLKPEVTLWISFGLSHAVQFEQEVEAGKFPDLKTAISHEFATLPQNTTKQVFIDGDVPQMVEATSNIKAKVTKVSQAELKRYSVYPTRTDFVFEGTTFHFAQPQPRDLTIQLLMLEKLVKYLKISLKTDFSNTPFPPGRSSYLEGKNGLKIIDSSYNAHLISVESILDMAKHLKAGHKWLIIGDIVDQGSIEGEEHTKLADMIAKVKPEKIILVGRRTKQYTAPRLKELGFTVQTTLDPKKALQYIEKNTVGDETLIFKGSQYLEWIIEKLLKNPEDASKLCRREPAAVKRRHKRGLD